MNAWLPLDSAPKDGRTVQLRIEHMNLKYAKTAEDRARWVDDVEGYWTDFQGGGWVWYGMYGQVAAWRPKP